MDTRLVGARIHPPGSIAVKSRCPGSAYSHGRCGSYWDVPGPNGYRSWCAVMTTPREITRYVISYFGPSSECAGAPPGVARPSTPVLFRNE